MFDGSKILTARTVPETYVTVAALANAVKVTPATIHNWQNGAGEPKAGQLFALAQTLRRPLDYFYDKRLQWR